ncbi:hypothetical protein AK88_03244 [Plasmodium fragile]|uniref:Uncharacterized protein n=1 Tax=Plasmodium fragile TaxID=5857 RepID=A0A0D9QN02_PLAFR|nr:uncharacterized protein AK88_03244 [Plasmodium fragile]KJP87076.1 hypothetical protein AK88_03244 [Plasmodium fragile]
MPPTDPSFDVLRKKENMDSRREHRDKTSPVKGVNFKRQKLSDGEDFWASATLCQSPDNTRNGGCLNKNRKAKGIRRSSGSSESEGCFRGNHSNLCNNVVKTEMESTAPGRYHPIDYKNGYSNNTHTLEEEADMVTGKHVGKANSAGNRQPRTLRNHVSDTYKALINICLNEIKKSANAEDVHDVYRVLKNKDLIFDDEKMSGNEFDRSKEQFPRGSTSSSGSRASPLSHRQHWDNSECVEKGERVPHYRVNRKRSKPSSTSVRSRRGRSGALKSCHREGAKGDDKEWSDEEQEDDSSPHPASADRNTGRGEVQKGVTSDQSAIQDDDSDEGGGADKRGEGGGGREKLLASADEEDAARFARKKLKTGMERNINQIEGINRNRSGGMHLARPTTREKIESDMYNIFKGVINMLTCKYPQHNIKEFFFSSQDKLKEEYEVNKSKSIQITRYHSNRCNNIYTKIKQELFYVTKNTKLRNHIINTRYMFDVYNYCVKNIKRNITVLSHFIPNKKDYKFITKMMFNHNCENVVTSGKDGYIKIFHAMTGNLILCIKAHQNAITDFDVHRSDKYILSCDEKGVVKFWLIDKHKFKTLFTYRRSFLMKNVHFFYHEKGNSHNRNGTYKTYAICSTNSYFFIIIFDDLSNDSHLLYSMDINVGVVKFFPYLQFSYSLSFNVSPYMYNSFVMSNGPIRGLKNSYLMFINTSSQDTDKCCEKNDFSNTTNYKRRKKKPTFLLLTSKPYYDNEQRSDELLSITPNDMNIIKYVNRIDESKYRSAQTDDVIELTYKDEKKKQKMSDEDLSYAKIFHCLEINVLQNNTKKDIGFCLFKRFEDFNKEIVRVAFSNRSADFLTVQFNGSIYLWHFQSYIDEMARNRGRGNSSHSKSVHNGGRDKVNVCCFYTSLYVEFFLESLALNESNKAKGGRTDLGGCQGRGDDARKPGDRRDQKGTINNNAKNDVNDENEYDNLFVISSTSCSSYCYSSSGNEYVPRVNREKELKKKRLLRAQREVNIGGNAPLGKGVLEEKDKSGAANNVDTGGSSTIGVDPAETNNGSVIMESIVHSSGSASARRSANGNNRLDTNRLASNRVETIHLSTNRFTGNRFTGSRLAANRLHTNQAAGKTSTQCVYNENTNNKPKMRAKKLNYKISNVSFNMSDEYLIVADGITNKSNSSKEDTFAVTMKTNLSIFCLKTYEEIKNFDLKECNSYVSFIKPNPFFTDVILFACFRKYIYLLNVQKKKIIKKYSYDSELKNLSAEWSQNGYLFIVSHNYGYFSIFTLNKNASYKLTLSDQITSYQLCSFNEPSINDVTHNFDNVNSLPDVFMYDTFEPNNIEGAVDLVRFNSGAGGAAAMAAGITAPRGFLLGEGINNTSNFNTGVEVTGAGRSFRNNWRGAIGFGTSARIGSNTRNGITTRNGETTRNGIATRNSSKRNDANRNKGRRGTRRSNRIIEDSSELSCSANSIYTLYTDSNSKNSKISVQDEGETGDSKKKKKKKKKKGSSDEGSVNSPNDEVKIIDKDTFQGREDKHVINLENIPSNREEVINVEDVHRECIKNNSNRRKEVINLDNVLSDNYSYGFKSKRTARNRSTAMNVGTRSSAANTAGVRTRKRLHIVRNEGAKNLSSQSNDHSSSGSGSGSGSGSHSGIDDESGGSSNGEHTYQVRKNPFLPMKKRKNRNVPSSDFKSKSDKHDECLLTPGSSHPREGAQYPYDISINKLKEFFSGEKRKENEQVMQRDRYMSDGDTDFEKCSSINFFSDNSNYGSYSDDLFIDLPRRCRMGSLQSGNNHISSYESDLHGQLKHVSRRGNPGDRVDGASCKGRWTPHCSNGMWAEERAAKGGRNPWSSASSSSEEDDYDDHYDDRYDDDEEDDAWHGEAATDDGRIAVAAERTARRKNKLRKEGKPPCLLNFTNSNILVDKKFKIYEQHLQPLLPKFSSFNCSTNYLDKIRTSPVDPICVQLNYFAQMCRRLKRENTINLKSLLTFDVLYKALINYGASGGVMTIGSMKAGAHSACGASPTSDHKKWFNHRGASEAHGSALAEVKGERRSSSVSDGYHCVVDMDERLIHQAANAKQHFQVVNSRGDEEPLPRMLAHRKNEKSEAFLRLLRGCARGRVDGTFGNALGSALSSALCNGKNREDNPPSETDRDPQGQQHPFGATLTRCIETFKQKSGGKDKYKMCYMNAVRVGRSYKRFINVISTCDNSSVLTHYSRGGKRIPAKNSFQHQMDEMSQSLLYQVLKKFPCREEEDIDSFIYYKKKTYSEKSIKEVLQSYLKHYNYVEQNIEQFDHRLFIYTNDNRMLFMNSHTMKLLKVLQENYCKSLIRESFNLMNNTQLKGRNCIIKNVDGINNCTFLNPYSLYLRSTGNYDFLNSRTVQNTLLSSYARYNELFAMFRGNMQVNNVGSGVSARNVANGANATNLANVTNTNNTINVTNFLLNYENVLSSGRNTDIAVISEHSSIFTSDQSANFFSEDEEDDDDDDDDYVSDDYDFGYHHASSSYSRRNNRRNRRRGTTRTSRRTASSRRRTRTRNNNNNNTPRRTSARNRKNNEKKNYNCDAVVHVNVRKSDRLRNKEMNRRENNGGGASINNGDDDLLNDHGDDFFNNGSSSRHLRNSSSNYYRSRYNTRSSNTNRDFT